MSQREACLVARRGKRGREGGMEGGWREAWSCLTVSLGAPCTAVYSGAGVTDARGCSARLGAASPQSPCQKCCSRTRRVHVAASAAQGERGVGVDGVRRDTGSDRGLWQMQLVEASEARPQQSGTCLPSEAWPVWLQCTLDLRRGCSHVLLKEWLPQQGPSQH